MVDDDDGFTWDPDSGASSTAPAPASPPVAGMSRRPLMPEVRYTLGAELGEGGFSRVFQAHDVVLQRDVAMKLLKPGKAQVRTFHRFENAARICARLTHQAIVQILDVGIWSDGRPFLTMPIVQGRTLSAVLDQERRRTAGQLDLEGLRRLVSFVRIACDALAYSHDHGVLHRDIKPSNIMVSDYNEVIVLDWGLARHRRDQALEQDATGETQELASPQSTQTGSVQGTTGYMSPEQARGEGKAIDARTDVFSLGAVLYEILTGEPPWGNHVYSALTMAQEGRVRTVPRQSGMPMPLIQICERALSIEPADRYADARALSLALSDWLVGLAASRRALELVKASDQTIEQAQEKRSAAVAHAHRAHELLSGVHPAADEVEKHAAWSAEERASALRREAELLDIERVQLLHMALSVADLPDAHYRLADIYYAQHREAEAKGDVQAADRYAYLLREHSRGRYDDYLRGVGWLTLHTSRPVAVTLFRFTPKYRRLQPVRVGEWASPLERVELPIGSYLAHLKSEDGLITRVPFEIRRSEVTTGSLHPGGEVVPVWIPLPGDVPDDMLYVPAGPFWSGGGVGVFGAPLPLRRIWVDGFLMDRFPVTNQRYLAFLNDLVARGEEARAIAHCPQDRGGELSIYNRDEQGRFVLAPMDIDGDVWDPQWPVVSLTIENMRAFAAWRTELSGRTHRLPYEMEWEKAARGADQRSRVWGTDATDPTWCRIGISAMVGKDSPVRVEEYPADESPYGIRGMAGNVSDICEDNYTRDGPVVKDGQWSPVTQPTQLHPVRGAGWNAHPNRTHIGVRGGIRASGRSTLCGFRLVIPYR